MRHAFKGQLNADGDDMTHDAGAKVTTTTGRGFVAASFFFNLVLHALLEGVQENGDRDKAYRIQRRREKHGEKRAEKREKRTKDESFALLMHGLISNFRFSALDATRRS